MANQKRSTERSLLASLVIAASLLGTACGTVQTLDEAPPDSDRFDSSSGLTFRTASGVDVFARTDSRYSRSARDYLYLAPIETNQQGLHEYYLWVGVASTLDRDYLYAESNELETLFIKLVGEPMEFELEPLEQLLPQLAGRRLYRTPLVPQAQLVTRVSLNQLELLSTELPASVSVRDDGGATRAFPVWEAHEDLARFIESAGGTSLVMSGDFPRK